MSQRLSELEEELTIVLVVELTSSACARFVVVARGMPEVANRRLQTTVWETCARLSRMCERTGGVCAARIEMAPTTWGSDCQIRLTRFDEIV